MSRSSARAAVRAVAGLLLVALPTLVLSGAGCVEAEGRFFVQDFCSTDAQEGECSGEATVSFVANGCNVVRETCTEGQRAVATLRSGMRTSISEANNNNVETSDIIVTGYDVRVNNGLGGETTFIFNTYAFLPPLDTVTIPIQLIPINEEAFDLLDEVRASQSESAGFAGIRFYGRTSGGLEVETPEAFLSVTFLPNAEQ